MACKKISPVESKNVFYPNRRNNAVDGSAIIVVSMLGHKHPFPRIDPYYSLPNLFIILSWIGPMTAPKIIAVNQGKYFGSAYASFCGMIFISTLLILMAPIADLFINALHLQRQATDDDKN